MARTILVTGSTDGIGLETARQLVSRGHEVLLHGRDAGKLASARTMLSSLPGAGRIGTFLADLSRLDAVEELATEVAARHERLDVLVNNAGVLRTPSPRTDAGLDVRFVVNTIAPWLLTRRLLPLLGNGGRVVNLSSAAQARVDPAALAGNVRLDDMAAYAQSKLALTQWSRHLALSLGKAGPVVVAVNPGSMLGSKMVREGFGVEGGDLRTGADVLVRAALSDEFAEANGLYFDNDSGCFAPPHPDALDTLRCRELVAAMEGLIGGPDQGR
ncbi:SDR family NAD(P)-dependent oxidoreductase [Arenimonas donghaensis]|uniref:Oxidoreductase n=1 Tax=Arenimonas donghaensis DSM 18148 = HO3-R19 TaxID=1121014 RepID=A0A087MGD9_9GAMM|nr:SDR family NAD(P)-dependent oxidoreductase [Arenimonas donghaensis]KFL35942.1 hypothetical protein N788_06615 [Arenimonas donghaensis DSM 18148 = HO3-R19]